MHDDDGGIFPFSTHYSRRSELNVLLRWTMKGLHFLMTLVGQFKKMMFCELKC